MKTSFRSAKNAVIAALLQNDCLSRLELSNHAGVSPAAITEVTQTFLQQGLIRETPGAVTGKSRGRPMVQLSLQAAHSCFVGFSIEEEGVILVVTDLHGEVLYHEALPPLGGPDKIPKVIVAAFNKALRRSGVVRARVRGAGIAVAGMVDAAKGVCQYSAGLNWHDVPIANIVSTALGIPAWVDNDANAIAVREKTFGRAREHDNFSSIVLGQTIGSAHYMHGMLYRGETGSAGEIGHIAVDPQGLPCRCGRRGCLDTVAGGHALQKAAQAQGLSVSNMAELEEYARRGQGTAIALLRSAGNALGAAIATLVHLNNPRAVLFTDLAGFGSGMFSTATRQAIENAILPRLLGSTIILFGEEERYSLPSSAASIATLNYLMSI